MKKLLTLTLAVAALGASGAVKAPGRLALKSAPAVETKHHETAGVRADGDERQYVSLGTGSMTDDMVAPLFSFKPVTFPVEILQDADGGPYYRVLAPYGQNWADAMKAVNGQNLLPGEYDYAATTVLDIDASDPDDVYFPKTYIGCDWGYGEMYIGVNSRYNATLADGVISAPILGIAVGDDDGAVAGNRNGKFRIVLPGYAVADYEIEIEEQSTCTIDGRLKGTITAGADIASMLYTIVPGLQEDEILSEVETTAVSGAPIAAGEFDIEMEPDSKKETIVVVAFNAAGEQVGYVWRTYYRISATDEGWASEGTAVWTDDLLPTFFSFDAEELETEMQRSVDNPAIFRLVNPYAGHSLWEKYGHDTDNHPHYIYINAEDPECIFVEESPLCIDLGFGGLRVSSFVRYFLDMGTDLEECKELELGAVIDNGSMFFPEEHLIVSMMKYENADWYTAGTDGYTELQLPENFTLEGVVDNVTVDSDNGPTRYYNLQGAAVAHPQKGNLYIEVKGTRANTVIR